MLYEGFFAIATSDLANTGTRPALKTNLLESHFG